MRYRVLFVVLLGLLVCASAYADIPKLINFQGRLTDASGKFVSDGNYSLTFKIYSDSSGGSAKWSEAQSVAVSKGLFNVILGSQTPIPDSIFNYPNTWLGIQVGADPEMSPRQRLSSLGYAYRGAKADTSSYSMNSDKLDGLDASDFLSPVSDYGRSGVATDLYEGTSTLTSKYVNVSGPDSVYSTSGTAFKGRVSGSSGATIYGIQGYADNSSTGPAFGGYFITSYSGTGTHYGVIGDGYGSSSALTCGVFGYAYNNSTGQTFAGYFDAATGGTGTKFGVYAIAPSGGYAGYFSGNMAATGTKSAAVKVDNGEYRLLYTMESPENWFEDFGGGNLQNGATTVQIDPLFAQVVNTQMEYHVFLTPRGDCKGLYVINQTPTSFEVRELQNGTSNISFSYRIVAKRKGYEDIRMAKMLGQTPEEMEAEQAKRMVEREEERARMERKRMEQQRLEIEKEQERIIEE